MATRSVEERKLELQERQVALEEQKLAGERGLPWKNPLLIAILTAAAAAGGNAVVSLLNADGLVRVERLKGEQALITEMIKTGGDDAKTAANLRFLVETGLISDATRRAQLRSYLDRLKARPDLLPSLPSAGALPASAAKRAALIAPGDACKARLARQELCIQNGILLQPNGKPFDVADGTRRTDPLKAQPVAIILHFSGGPDGAAKALFKSPAAPGSAHIEINRDGSITQLVPFDIAANHVGASVWNGLRNLNSNTIGVSFANWGRLQGGPGTWRSWSGKAVPDNKVFVHGSADHSPEGWELYSEAEVEAGERVVSALIAAYPTIRAVLPHSAVGMPPGRKTDPGPAMPIQRLQAVTGRR